MADFCSECSKEHGFGIDIDVKVEFLPLMDGEMAQVICEGCSMGAIGRDNGLCVVYFTQFHSNKSMRSKWFHFDIETNTTGEEYKQLNKDYDE